MAVDNSGEDVSEVSLWVDIVELASLNERGDDCPMFSAAIRAGEESILAIEGNGTNGTLNDVGVDFDAAVVDEADKPIPTCHGIAVCFGQLGLLADEREFFLEPRLESIRGGTAVLLANGTVLVCAQAPDLRLDPVERSDALEGFAGEGGGTCGSKFIKAPADMAPAEGKLDCIALGQGAVSGIAVHLQDAGEAVEVAERPDSLAVRCIDLGSPRRIAAAPGAVVASVCPELSCLGPAPPRIEYRCGRFIGKQLGRCLAAGQEAFMEWLQVESCPSHPVGQCGAVERDPLTGIEQRG